MVALRRTGAPASPRARVSGGSHRPKVTGPRGAAFSATASAGRPVSSSAQLAGSLTVAEASRKTGPVLAGAVLAGAVLAGPLLAGVAAP